LSKEIKPIHTCCKNCSFAKYESKTQIGCELDYINKYKDIGAEVLEAYDNDLEFYIINEKKCLGYREESYFKKLDMNNSTIEEKINYFNSHNTIQYLCVVNLRNFNEQSFEQLTEQFASIPIGPKKIIFIRYMDQSPLFEYKTIQHFLETSKINCEWRLQTMISSDIIDNEILHNIVNLNKKYRFILYIEEIDYNINQLVSTANDIVYNKLKHFHVLSNENKNNKIFSAPSYRYSYIVNKENLLNNHDNYIIV
jgi:hypothetical protein